MSSEDFYTFITVHYAVAPLTIFCIYLVFLAFVGRRSQELIRNLRSAASSFAAWNPSDESPGEHDVRSFVRLHLVGLSPVRATDWPEARLVLSKDIDDVLDSYVERRTATVRFVLGPLATGFALVCTFFLIAHVLQNDVKSALGSAGTSELAGAVSTLGVKFYISTAGIGSSLLFAMATPYFRKRMLHAAHAAATQLTPFFCTPATLAAATQMEVLRELQDARERRAETSEREAERERDRMARDAERESERRRLEGDREAREAALHRAHAQGAQAALMKIQEVLVETQKEMGKLQSIEVTVKDLGTVVVDQVKHMLTNDVGEQMRDMLRDVMSDAATLSEGLQKALIDGFQKTIEREVPQLKESLTAIQRSIEGQAESPMERLLEQLQSVISGGMRGESAQMSAAIQQFADVIPGLADQLRSTASNMTTEMQSRSAENSRANEQLISQVTQLLGRLETQQVATETLVQNIGKAASESAGSMIEKVQTASGALFEDLLKTSRADVDEMLGRLREATQASAGNYSNLEASVSATSRSILEARDGLQSAADSIRQLTTDSRTAMAEARQAHEVAAQASSAFDRAATNLRQGVESMRDAVDGARQHAGAQASLLAEHRKQLAELEAMWPKLFEEYLRSFDNKSNQLLQRWDEFYAKTDAFAKNVGGPLADAAEDLRTEVNRLATLHESRRS